MSGGNEINPEALISLRNIGLSYWLKAGLFHRKKFWAIKDISFDLFKGDSIAIIGKNGVGKSTLLRLLAGVMGPDRGKIVFNGVSTSLLSLNLGFVPYLSGRENAILGGMFQGLTKGEIEAKLDEIIAFADLEDFMDQPISTYSSGMVARLGFSVAFQLRPDVLLVDEVIGVGDAAFQEKSKQVMKERIKAKDTTIVLVSHSVSDIRELCNRVIWIEDHVVQADGPTEEVLHDYGIFLAHGTKKIST